MIVLSQYKKTSRAWPRPCAVKLVEEVGNKILQVLLRLAEAFGKTRRTRRQKKEKGFATQKRAIRAPTKRVEQYILSDIVYCMRTCNFLFYLMMMTEEKFAPLHNRPIYFKELSPTSSG